jgi:hypothetical protein
MNPNRKESVSRLVNTSQFTLTIIKTAPALPKKTDPPDFALL